MSKELTGSKGHIVGSEKYFGKLNEDHFLASIMSDKTNYYSSLMSLSKKIPSIVDEIHRDLSIHIGIIRYIPKKDRDNAILLLEGFQNIYLTTWGIKVQSENCISILSLSCTSTKPKLGASVRDIEKAVKVVKDYKVLSPSVCMDTLSKAIMKGQRSAIDGNAKKSNS